MSSHQLNSAFTAAKYRERDRNGPMSRPGYTARDVRLHPGPRPDPARPDHVGWYGLGYAVGLAVTYLVMVRLARRAGERAGSRPTG